MLNFKTTILNVRLLAACLLIKKTCNSLYSRCFKGFCGFANILLHIPLKMGNEKDFEYIVFNLNHFYLNFKNIFLFLTKGLFIFFEWSYSQSCFDVGNVLKIDVENGIIFSTVSNV